ncbi:MAG TPA: glutamine amidotransferase [Planctomycetota bacterium]|jgi:hypothetical protein
MFDPSSLRFDSPVSLWLLLALAALAGLSIRRAYHRTTRATHPGLKLLLGFLRLCAFATLLLCLSRPVLVSTLQLRENALGFVALDSSASMELKDASEDRTRWDIARSVLSSHRADLQRLSNAMELQRCVFDSTVRKVDRLPGEAGPSGIEKPLGTSTDLVKLMEALAADAGGMSAAGAVVISDGRHNAPKDVIPAAMMLERAGVPLYVIGLGQETTPTEYRDVRIKDLVVPEKAFIRSRMVFRVEVEATLPSAVAVPLYIEVDGKKIWTQNLVLNPGTNRVCEPIEVPFTPESLGVHRVVASVGSVPNEADLNNNVRSAFFRVYRSKLKVWYVEGALRKEFGAIRSALETAPNVSFSAINAFQARTSDERELLPEDLDQTKLVIIGDLPASRFSPARLAALTKYVEDGGAVLMIGGMSNFGAGDWHQTPLASVLPVLMSAEDGMRDGPLAIDVESGETAHPILNVGNTPAQSAALWRQLPPLPGINRVRSPRAAAHVLLRADTSPLLAVQDYGKGRSAVFMADMTWQWALKAGQGDLQKRFWRNLATWLTRSDYRDSDKAVFADAERLQLQASEEGAFRVFVHDSEKAGPALKDARIVVSLTRLQGEIESPVFKEDVGKGCGEFEKRFALGSPGSYRFRAAAVAPASVPAVGDAGERILDSDSVDVQVIAPDLEHDNPKANLALLRRIASITGGMYFDAEHAGDAFAALLKRQAGYSKTITEATDLWNRPWMLALFVSLLTAEWLIRRRCGLI